MVAKSKDSLKACFENVNILVNIFPSWDIEETEIL